MSNLSFEAWTLIYLLTSLLFPRGIVTKELQNITWYQRSFPMIAKEDETVSSSWNVDNSRYNKNWFLNLLHRAYFSGVCVGLNYIFVGFAAFYTLYYDEQNSYYDVNNALILLYVLLVEFFPWFMIHTESAFFYDEIQAVKAEPPLKSISKVRNVGLTFSRKAIVWYAVLIFCVAVSSAIVMLFGDNRSAWHVWVADLFLWLVVLFSFFGIILGWDLSYAPAQKVSLLPVLVPVFPAKGN